ncbi:hypothetical protein G3A_07540 [Bacillus sp. 17376]|uniref:Uncharacterized protein n=1 Tax=Mesobacillus boroniphilus JCM 21738 TaxID=1294265 RepID=W4RJK8_9BACI|nr:hypothetical protein [Mesobacillus boroniphilus]ESU33216.1 hypothetical protein G3A_07540 [Bacillus sp. 17376]GAE44476.1 hypothetical protein JCM21738_1190 [Mesobacillus boroniphilus JCM 21738]
MAGTIFWLLIVASGFLFIWGLINKSWKLLLMSGMAVTLPSLYFLGAENEFRLLALVPLLPFGLSYFLGKMRKESR